MQSPPFPRYLVPPRSKYSPQHHVLQHPQLPFLPQGQDQVSHPYKTTGKIIILYILIFRFLDGYIVTETEILSHLWPQNNHFFSTVKPTRCSYVPNLFYLGMSLYMFRTVFPSIISSSKLYIQQPNRYCALLASKQTAVSV